MVVDEIQRRLAGAVRSVLAGRQTDAGPGPMTEAPGDPGLFGPDSAAWQVHADLSMLVGGIRALLLQSLHPLAMAGVAEHSDYRRDPLGRLQRTGRFLGETTYGSTATAERAIATVRHIHERVRGVAPDGRPYAATDPHLIAWIHVTEVDSFLAAHQRFGAQPLSPVDADRYVAEMAVVGHRLGAQELPTDTSGLADAIAAFRPELGPTAASRDATRFLLAPPLPLRARPAYGVLFGGAIGILPGWARGMLRLPIAPGVEPLVLRPAATTLVRLLGWALGTSPALEAARRRAECAAV
ncbi:MAG: DUF2236 domain-containing protein [Acidimicrobiales bacterium]|nr:DUF2236 domain-containing protein [Acidimicrobiales bacterium]